MGQEEVYEFLKSNPDKTFTAEDVAQHFNKSVTNISPHLAKLAERPTTGIICRLKKSLNGKRMVQHFSYINVTDMSVFEDLVQKLQAVKTAHMMRYNSSDISNLLLWVELKGLREDIRELIGERDDTKRG